MIKEKAIEEATIKAGKNQKLDPTLYQRARKNHKNDLRSFKMLMILSLNFILNSMESNLVIVQKDYVTNI